MHNTNTSINPREKAGNKVGPIGPTSIKLGPIGPTVAESKLSTPIQTNHIL